MTTLSALSGRRLGDLADLHPALDGRRIETVVNRNGNVEITLTRRDIAIADDPDTDTPRRSPTIG
jgi:hypothetical protein